jgi:solute:Na+ symporter, SSS family
MLFIGFYFAGRMKSLKDFFCGGNHVPWWVSGVSLYMTTFSAFTFVSYSALAYNNGLVCITIWWMTVPCAVLTAYFLASRWRRIDTTSPVEFVERRYGPVLRQGFSWAGVPLIVFDDALKLFVIGKMVTVSLGMENPWAFPLAIAICGTIMLTYTLMGGLWAVMITDFVQFIVMATAVLVMVPLVLTRVGGLGAIVQEAPDGFWRLTSDDFTIWWLIAFGLIEVLIFATKWPIVQRYYSVPTDAEARKVGYTLGVLTFVGVPLLFLPAFAARVFMPGIEDGNTVYPLICMELLPVGLLGMVIAGMFSATMSMLSSDYNAAASVITNDIYKRLFDRNARDGHLVMIGRLATLGVGLVAVGVAVVLSQIPDLEGLVKIMAGVFSLLLPPVAIPMLFGLLTRKISNKGALVGFCTGATLGAAAYTLSFIKLQIPADYRALLFLPADYAGGLKFLREVQYLTWITAVPTFGLMWLVSLVAPDSQEKQARVAAFLDGIGGKSAEAPKEQDRTSDASAKGQARAAVSIIGLATAAMGALLVLAVVVTGAAATAGLSIGVGAALFAGGLGAAALARRRPAA